MEEKRAAQIVDDILKLMKPLSDDDRAEVLAKLREQFCTQCGQLMEGSRTCWNCYDSPCGYDYDE